MGMLFGVLSVSVENSKFTIKVLLLPNCVTILLWHVINNNKIKKETEHNKLITCSR